MSNSIDLHKKTFFVITGASRGIGQMMALECSKQFRPGSVVVLLARSATGLAETKSLIERAASEITVCTASIDLTTPSASALNTILQSALNEWSTKDFELAFIIHNVGTIGDITKGAHEFTDETVWKTYYQTNVFSVVTLNACFVQLFADVEKLIVNVTSKCSSVPYESFTLYCSSRAAREMYFKVLAAENASRDTRMIVLNYSPGCCDTDMTVDVQANSASNAVRTQFKTLRDTDAMIKPIETAQKLMKVLMVGAFQSGDYVDYYDN